MIKKQKHLGWGMVGLGSQAGRLAQAISRAKGNTLVAAFGNESNHAKDFASRYNTEVYPNLKSLLAAPSVHAVCIASKNDEHATQAVAAVRAGKDMLCEKPLALTLAEGRKILAESRKYRVRGAVNFQLRMHPAIQYLREAVVQKSIGQLRSIEMQWSIGSFTDAGLPPLPPHMQWREKPAQSGGGAIMARGVHLFDLARFLSTREVLEVQAYSDATSNVVDRTAIGIMHLEDNVTAIVMTSKITPGTDNRIVVHGSRGSMTLRHCFDSGERAVLETRTAHGVQTKYFRPVDLLVETFKAFGKTNKNNPLASIEDGVAAIAITQAFTASAKKGSVIKVRK